MSDDAVSTQTAAGPPPFRRDDRIIVAGVQLPAPDGRGFKVYWRESDADELDRRLTPAQVARLKAAGDLIGSFVGYAGAPARLDPGPGEMSRRAEAEAGAKAAADAEERRALLKALENLAAK